MTLNGRNALLWQKIDLRNPPGWKAWKLITLTISPTPSLFVAQDHRPTPKGTWGNLGETRGGVGKSGVLEHKSGNISDTRKDRGKVTIQLNNALSNGTIHDPLWPPLPRNWGFATPTQNSNLKF